MKENLPTSIWEEEDSFSLEAPAPTPMAAADKVICASDSLATLMWACHSKGLPFKKGATEKSSS